MSDMEFIKSSKDAIEALSKIRWLAEHSDSCNTVEIDAVYDEALEFAINSLEVDEAYQLEYEKPEFCEDCVPRKLVERIIKSPRSQEQMLTILNLIPSVLPKADNSVLEDIKAKISDMYPNYIDEKGYRMVRKSDVLNIIDYCMGK